MSFPVDCLYHHRHAKAWPYYLCSSSPKHNPNSTLSLHWAFNNILVVLKDNFDFELAILSVVPTTFRFTIPFAWCRRWSITSSWNFSTNVSWSSSTFWALPGYHHSKYSSRYPGNVHYICITSKISRPTPACIYYYYSAHWPLSSMHLVY